MSGIQVPSVQSRNLPGNRFDVQPPDGSLGGGKIQSDVSEASSDLAKTISRGVAVAQRRADQMAVLEAENEMSKAETSTLYDPASGLLNTREKDAMGAPEIGAEALAASAEDISKKYLSNDIQRGEFKNRVRLRLNEADRALQRHVATERVKYDDNMTQSFLENERSAAENGYSDPDRVALSIERQVAAIKDHSERNGVSGEETTLRISKAVSGTHRGIVEKMIVNNQVIPAGRYYSENKKYMTGDDAIVTDKILNNPDIMFHQASVILENSRGTASIPVEMLSKMSTYQRREIEARRGQLLQGIPEVTDWETYTRIMDLPPSQISTLDPMVYRSKLADQEFKRLISVRDELRNSKGSSKELDGYRTKNQIVDSTLRAIDVKPSALADEFKRRVAEQEARIQSSGKKVDDQEFQRICDDLVVKGVTKNGWMGIGRQTKRMYQVSPGEKVYIAGDSIPKAERARIVRSLTGMGINPTEDRIVDLYVQRLNTEILSGPQ